MVRAARAPCRRSGTSPAHRAESRGASDRSTRSLAPWSAPSLEAACFARAPDHSIRPDVRASRDRVRGSSRLLAAEGRYDWAMLEIAVPGARVDQRLEPAAHALKLFDLVLDLLEALLGAAFDAADV